MENQKSNSSLKAVIIILSILLVGSLAWMYKMSTDSKKTEQTLLSDKDQLIKDLEEAKASYDAAIADNSGLKEELVAERAKIEDLLEKVKKSEGDVASLRKYKNDYVRLKREMDGLIAENNRLKGENENLTVQRDSLGNELTTSKAYNDTIVKQNAALSETVTKAQKVTVVNLKTNSYKQRSSGKLVETEKARRVDVIEISFTLAANEVAQSGNKTYYIQVIDPKNNVIGEKKTEVFGDYNLTYSFVTNAIYENKTMDIKEKISGKDFEKGLYHVNVFDKGQLVGNSTFTLK
jgi:regulator of replication initiation timing